MLNSTQLKQIILDKAEPSSFSAAVPTYALIPFLTPAGLTVASVVYSNIKDGEKNHTAAIAFLGNDTYTYFCGNDFLVGKLSQTEAAELAKEAVANIGLSDEVSATAIEEMMKHYDDSTTNSGCNNIMFLSNLQRAITAGDFSATVNDKTISCKHVSHLFSMTDDVDQVIEKLRRTRKSALSEKKSSVVSDNPIAFTLTNFGFQGEAVLVTGPGGHGKTHAIKEYAEINDLEFIEVHGHGQIEAIDLYGYVSVDDEGNKGWVDGPVSQAARKASKGIKTLLFIDEFVNIPMREAAGLKAAFEPYKGHYFFKTGRNVRDEDGLLVQETLKVSVEHLQIAAAANIGDGYASEEIDKALKQRFLISYYEAPEEKIISVLSGICIEKGFSTLLVNKLLSFRDALRNAREAGEPIEVPSLRHLSRKFLGLMKCEADLEDIARAQMLQFVIFDYEGKPVAEQVELYEDIVEKTLAE